MIFKYKIAKTIEGKEFLHSQKDCYYVPAASKEIICKALNESKWNLKPGEKWYIYEVEYTDDFYIFQSINKRNGKIYIKTV